MMDGWEKLVKEIEEQTFSTKQMNHRYEIYSVGNIVNNNVIYLYGDI